MEAIARARSIRESLVAPAGIFEKENRGIVEQDGRVDPELRRNIRVAIQQPTQEKTCRKDAVSR